MKKLFFLIMTALVLSVGCNSEKKEASNPLLQPFTTPYEVPPFDQIKLEHYQPAFEFAMQQHNEEIEAIVNNQEAPTFENTIVALDQSGLLLNKIGNIFFNVYEAESDEAMQALANELTPAYSSHFD
ncbi:MAG: peptidase M3, partial [Bacteroidales bacterium]|nr:peptidase M3 [Bacteroidales bacterium]